MKDFLPTRWIDENRKLNALTYDKLKFGNFLFEISRKQILLHLMAVSERSVFFIPGKFVWKLLPLLRAFNALIAEICLKGIFRIPKAD